MKYTDFFKQYDELLNLAIARGQRYLEILGIGPESGALKFDGLEMDENWVSVTFYNEEDEDDLYTAPLPSEVFEMSAKAFEVYCHALKNTRITP